jgi:hypothetical protein
VLPFHWIGALSALALMTTGHVLMLPAMLVAFLRVVVLAALGLPAARIGGVQRRCRLGLLNIDVRVTI